MFELMGFMGAHVTRPHAPVLCPLQSMCIRKEKEIVSSAPPPPGLGLSSSQKCRIRTTINDAVRVVQGPVDDWAVLFGDQKSKEGSKSVEGSGSVNDEQEAWRAPRGQPLPYRKPEDGQGRR